MTKFIEPTKTISKSKPIVTLVKFYALGMFERELALEPIGKCYHIYVYPKELCFHWQDKKRSAASLHCVDGVKI